MERPQSINEASIKVMALPESRNIKLGNGETVAIWRLNWIKFEAVWAELTVLLSALTRLPENSGEAELINHLAGAPTAVLKLAAVSTNLPETTLTQLPFDDVLAITAAAIELNFISSAGVRGFFSALTGLASAGE